MIRGRLGVCAASALVCTIVLASSVWGAYVKDFKEQADFLTGSHQRVSFSSELGGLALPKQVACVPFVWVPSPKHGIVSKIDARSGVELARYKTGQAEDRWEPCAVAGDMDGNAYIACTVPGRIGRVVRIAATESAGTDRNDVIELGENTQPVALAFDDSGSLWVALAGESALAKVDLVSRAIVARTPLVGKPSTMATDGRGSMWVLSHENRTLCRVNTVTGALTEHHDLGDCSPTWISVDQYGKLWIADEYSGLVGYQPNGGIWSRYPTGDIGGYAGVAVSPEGDIWVSCPAKHYVGHLSKEGSLIATIPVADPPGPLCVDGDGFIWAICEEGRAAVRIDPHEDKRVACVQTLSAPFSSTPFSSSIVDKDIAPDGAWRIVADSEITGAGWGAITWQGAENGGQIRVDVRSAGTFEALSEQTYERAKSGTRFTVPNGRYLEVKVSLFSSNHRTPILRSLRVEGINRSPDVGAAVASLRSLTQLDHGVSPVSIEGIVDPDGDQFGVVVTGVTQDEPASGLWNGDKSPDAIGVGDSTIWLRREADEKGNGRVYTVSFQAVDAFGAASTGKVNVSVPVQGMVENAAVDDGQRYNSARENSKNIALAVDR